MSRPCPVCAHLTLGDPHPGSYEICSVCFWEDDPVQAADPDMGGGANGVPLVEARENYRRLGVSEERFAKHVRPARPEEIPNGTESTVAMLHAA